MSDFRLHKIHQPKGTNPAADIVFIHGLGGHPFNTWKVGDSFWPEWLAEDFPTAQIWSLEHLSKAFTSKITGGGMGIIDRGRAIVDCFYSLDIGEVRPVVFIVHSLGGLLIKSALRKALDTSTKGVPRLLDTTAGIVFFSTPHTGSAIANIFKTIKLPMSDIASELQKGEPILGDLNEWYRSQSIAHNIKTRAYAENVAYLGKVFVVSKESADPGVYGCSPIVVQSNHFDICKFKSREDIEFLGTSKFIRSCIGDCEIEEVSRIDDFYVTKKAGDRLTLYEKLDKGNMVDEYECASISSEHIEKKLKKYDLLCSSRREQTSFIKEVFNNFDLFVKPLIESGSSKIEINEKIDEKVVFPIVSRGRKLFGEEATISEIREVIYFLTGNCHIKWSSN